MVLYLRAIDKIALNVRLKCQGVSLRLKPFRCSSVVGIVCGVVWGHRQTRGRRGGGGVSARGGGASEGHLIRMRQHRTRPSLKNVTILRIGICKCKMGVRLG